MTETVAYRTGRYSEHDDNSHIWKIADTDGIAAELYVSVDHHEIMNIEVRSDRRGEGLARRLYETAASQMDIYHAPETHRTPEGQGFAEAVGGESLPCLHGCCNNDEE